MTPPQLIWWRRPCMKHRQFVYIKSVNVKDSSLEHVRYANWYFIIRYTE